MPRRFIPETKQTYATVENAVKAVEKKYGSDDLHQNQTYIIAVAEDGRFVPVFIGERAVQAGIHIHFTCIN